MGSGMELKSDARILDEQIFKCILKRNLEPLKDLIGLSDEDISEISICLNENNGELLPELLQKILIARDKKVYKIIRCKSSQVDIGNIKLPKEWMYFIERAEGMSTKVEKIGDEKRAWYYYTVGNDVERECRTTNDCGDVVGINRYVIDSRGEIEDIEDALIKYTYKNGKKKNAFFYGSDFGMVYYEFDKNGNIQCAISDDFYYQRFEFNGKECVIVDGYVEPSEDGLDFRSRSTSNTDINKLSIDDMMRVILGDISAQEKSILLNSMDSNRKETVLRILKEVQPFFENVKNNEYLSQKRSVILRAIKEIVDANCARRLMISSQDIYIMNTFRKAVGATIGDHNVNVVNLGLTKPYTDANKDRN